MRILIQRFWRVPKPSCNWCPRITLAIAQDAFASGESWYGQIPDGHNMTREQIKKYLEERLAVEVSDVEELFGEIEVSKKQFKTMERWDRD
jgi:hypothetical protein